MTFYNVRKLSYLLGQDCSVVITGDSLAYNRYDFVDDPRMDAWDCPFGMKSWSFMLRDYLVSHGRGWIPAGNLEINSNISTTTFGEYNHMASYSDRLPMDEHGLILHTENSADIDFKSSPVNFCFITHPTEGAVFTSDDTEISLVGNKNLFNGYYYKWINSESRSFKNLNKNSKIQLVGASDVKTKVFLTGSGSKTAQWLLENSKERILKYKPNLCILIIGANNRRMNEPAGFKTALYELIDKLKKESCEILLISPPHSTTTDPAWGDDNVYKYDEKITKPIMDILKDAVSEYNLPYMNLFEFFSGTENDVWRFDNTHFTREGNMMLFEAIRDTFFKE